MLGVIVDNNLSALYSLSIKSLDVFSVINCGKVSGDEISLLTFSKSSDKFNGLVRFNDKGDIFVDKDDKKEVYGLSSFHTNPLPRIICVKYFESYPVIIGEVISYSKLKEIYIKLGIRGLAMAIEVDRIKSYRIDVPKHANSLLIDSDPFEYLLIQLGLSRIETHPFESDEYNTISNTELIRMYENNPRIEIINKSLSL